MVVSISTSSRGKAEPFMLKKREVGRSQAATLCEFCFAPYYTIPRPVDMGNLLLHTVLMN